MGSWGISTLLVWSVSPTSLPRVVVPLRGSQAFVRQVKNRLFNLGSKETSPHYFLLAVGSRASECVSRCRLLMLSIHSTEERRWNSADWLLLELHVIVIWYWRQWHSLMVWPRRSRRNVLLVNCLVVVAWSRHVLSSSMSWWTNRRTCKLLWRWCSNCSRTTHVWVWSISELVILLVLAHRVVIPVLHINLLFLLVLTYIILLVHQVRWRGRYLRHLSEWNTSYSSNSMLATMMVLLASCSLTLLLCLLRTGLIANERSWSTLKTHHAWVLRNNPIVLLWLASASPMRCTGSLIWSRWIGQPHLSSCCLIVLDLATTVWSSWGWHHLRWLWHMCLSSSRNSLRVWRERISILALGTCWSIHVALAIVVNNLLHGLNFMLIPSCPLNTTCSSTCS